VRLHHVLTALPVLGGGGVPVGPANRGVSREQGWELGLAGDWTGDWAGTGLGLGTETVDWAETGMGMGLGQGWD
jgi:hypothetical protein